MTIHSYTQCHRTHHCMHNAYCIHIQNIFRQLADTQHTQQINESMECRCRRRHGTNKCCSPLFFAIKLVAQRCYISSQQFEFVCVCVFLSSGLRLLLLSFLLSIHLLLPQRWTAAKGLKHLFNVRRNLFCYSHSLGALGGNVNRFDSMSRRFGAETNTHTHWQTATTNGRFVLLFAATVAIAVSVRHGNEIVPAKPKVSYRHQRILRLFLGQLQQSATYAKWNTLAQIDLQFNYVRLSFPVLRW